MSFIASPIPDLVIYEPRVFGDHRGYFFESFNEKVWAEQGIHIKWVQDNQARSTKGVLRGLHYQAGEFAQSKLVRVTEGEVLDVAVDLRPDSATYGKWHSEILSAENKRQMLVPRGFAHGYIVLSDTAEFQYKCDNFYAKHAEGGLRYDDPLLKIDWHFDLDKVLVSEKDLVLPYFGDHRAAL